MLMKQDSFSLRKIFFLDIKLIYYPLFNLKPSNSTERLPEEMNLIIQGKNLCHCLIPFLVIIIII